MIFFETQISLIISLPVLSKDRNLSMLPLDVIAGYFELMLPLLFSNAN